MHRGACFPHPDVQDVQLQPHVGLVLGEDLNTVDVAEVGQQGHQVGAGVDDVADSIAGPHQQRHVSLLFPLLGGMERQKGHISRNKEDVQVAEAGEQLEARVSYQQH